MTDLKRTEKITTLNRLNDRLFKFIFASEQHKDLLILFRMLYTDPEYLRKHF